MDTARHWRNCRRKHHRTERERNRDAYEARVWEIFVYNIFTYICTVLYVSWSRFNTWLLSPISSNFVSFPSLSFILVTIDRYPDLKYFYFLFRKIARHKDLDRSTQGKPQIKFQFLQVQGPLENGRRRGDNYDGDLSNDRRKIEFHAPRVFRPIFRRYTHIYIYIHWSVFWRDCRRIDDLTRHFSECELSFNERLFDFGTSEAP